jgi:hypothetical protein
MPSGFCIFSDLLYGFRRVGDVTPENVVNPCFGAGGKMGTVMRKSL